MAFLVWYFLYVICAAFAPGFMSASLIGSVNVGIIFGVLQFISTFVVTVSYLNWGKRRFDAQSTRLRVRLEQGRGR